MPWTGRPTRIDERVLDVLLHIGDELLAARGDSEGLDIGRGIPNDRCITRTECADQVLLEAGNELTQSE
jgi:hypothetical protein